MAILETESVCKQYLSPGGTVTAVDSVSLTIEAGEFVALHGPSGCGKSTLLLMAGGLLSPDSGKVRVTGEDPYQRSSDARAVFRGERIGFVFQQFHLIPFLNVLDNVLVGQMAGGGVLRRRAEELLEIVQLGHRRHHVPSMLSIGEQQRVALARAFLRSPRLILADEPTGNLDRENASIILQHLSHFAASGEGAVLMVTHDDRAKAAAGRAIAMEAGRLL